MSVSVSVRVTLIIGLLALAAAGAARGLYGNHDYYWPGAGASQVVIPVCWENPGAVAPAALEVPRRAVESTWQRQTRVVFTEWDHCTTGEPGIHVRIVFEGPSHAPGGVLLNGVNNGVFLNLNCSEVCVRSVTIHEFGHVLGFYHEEERPDYAEPAGTPPGGACAKQSYPNSSPQYYGAYDVDSVMSYCGGGDSELSAGDTASVQRAYGLRLPGSLTSAGGHCVAGSVQGGAAVALATCDESATQSWILDLAGGRLAISGQAGLACLTASGSVVRLATCTSAGSAAERWRLARVSLQGWGGLCLDLQGGRTANGTPVQLWQCSALGGANQRWTITAAGEIRFARVKKKCLTVPAAGTAYLATCASPASQRFSLVPGGQIRLSAPPGRCLDVQGPADSQFLAGIGLPRNGARIQSFDCLPAQLNQRWNVTGAIRHRASARCLTRSGGEAVGADLALAVCSGRGNQVWDYHWHTG
jgi:hypothetical protein